MTLKKIKNLTKKNRHLRHLCVKIFTSYKYIKFKKFNKVINEGKGKNKIKIWGVNNEIKILSGCFFKGNLISIVGNNNKVILENNVRMGIDNCILIYGNNIEVHIKDGTSFMENLQINATEDYSKIIIGKDCMFSNNIMIRTSDGHPIYDLKTNQRINNAKDVHIGDHVWVASKTDIMKGAVVPDGCIVGSHTAVTKQFDKKNCLIIGRPGIIKKENVYWEAKFRKNS